MDALLITTRERSQDVGKIVKYLDEKKLHKLVWDLTATDVSWRRSDQGVVLSC